MSALRRDANFLKRHRIMDYSLLVAVQDFEDLTSRISSQEGFGDKWSQEVTKDKLGDGDGEHVEWVVERSPISCAEGPFPSRKGAFNSEGTSHAEQYKEKKFWDKGCLRLEGERNCAIHIGIIDILQK